SAGPPSPPAGDVPHPGSARRRGSPRLRHHPGGRRAHRRRAQDPGRHAVPLDPAHARARAGRRGARARGGRRRTPPLLPSHPVRAGDGAGGGAAPGADGEARPRRGLRAGEGVMRPPLLLRALLRLYPAAFRAEYGGEMARVFRARRRDARGALPVLALWIATIGDTLVAAAQTHWDALRQDLAYAMRTFRRAPGFTATVLI